MKIKISVYLFAFAIVLTLGSFQLNYNLMLPGTWKVKSFSAGLPAGLTGKARVTAKADMKKLATVLNKSTFVFNKNGSATYFNKPAKWIMGKEVNTAIFTGNNKEVSVITIVLLNQHELVFTRLNDGVFQTLDLVK
jgi:hypothetical protein